MLGWRSTKSLTVPADTSITSMARTMAMTMTDTWSAIPTAVMTESSENTMSSRRIWSRTQPNRPALATLPSWWCRLHLLVDLPGGLDHEEEAAAQQDEAPPRHSVSPKRHRAGA